MPATPRRIRIGVHPNEQSLFVLRRLGLIEDRLAAAGAAVEWVEYRRGPDTGKLLAGGGIDFGGSGSTIPIEAQAGGVDDLVYVAVSPPRPRTAALLVPAASPLGGFADLAGRRVALLPSYLHFFHRILNAAGLPPTGAVPLTGLPDGRAALQSGEADAWLVSGVNLVEAERRGGLRPLADLATVIANRSIWYARDAFAQAHGDLLGIAVGAIAAADARIAANIAEAAGLFSRDVSGGSLLAEWTETLARRPWGAEPAGDGFLAEQQLGADLLADAGVIGRRIAVRAASPERIADAV